MNIAILIVSSASLVCSAGCLCIMLKTGRELQNTKTRIETDVEVFKEKTTRNISKIKAVLGDLEF